MVVSLAVCIGLGAGPHHRGLLLNLACQGLLGCRSLGGVPSQHRAEDGREVVGHAALQTREVRKELRVIVRIGQRGRPPVPLQAGQHGEPQAEYVDGVGVLLSSPRLRRREAWGPKA